MSNAVNAIQIPLAHLVTARARIDAASETQVVPSHIGPDGVYTNREVTKVRDPQADVMIAAIDVAIEALKPFALGGVLPKPGQQHIAEARIVTSTSITGRKV